MIKKYFRVRPESVKSAHTLRWRNFSFLALNTTYSVPSVMYEKLSVLVCVLIPYTNNFLLIGKFNTFFISFPFLPFGQKNIFMEKYEDESSIHEDYQRQTFLMPQFLCIYEILYRTIFFRIAYVSTTTSVSTQKLLDFTFLLSSVSSSVPHKFHQNHSNLFALVKFHLTNYSYIFQFFAAIKLFNIYTN